MVNKSTKNKSHMCFQKLYFLADAKVNITILRPTQKKPKSLGCSTEVKLQ